MITKIVVIVPKYAYIVKQGIFVTETYVWKEVSEQVLKMVSNYFIFFEINITSTGEQILKKRFPFK
jgi:hypothetical protein